MNGADLKFFLGRGTADHQDEVILDVGDDYQSLPQKMQAMCQWARAHHYDFIFKSDDDSYVVPARLMASGFQQHDYTGRVRGPSGPFPAPYCSGFGYWLSAKAAAVIADCKLNGDQAEDRMVANTLLEVGIRPVHDPRFGVLSSDVSARSCNEPPRVNNSLIAVCEFSPAQMVQVHLDWMTGKEALPVRQLPQGSLSDVCILIKTFLRDEYLFRCLDGIRKTMPEVKLVIVDDGYECHQKIRLYAELRELGHACSWLPFDSGFGAKANEGIKYCDRPYVLIGSDDFDFSHPSVRSGIEKLVAVLKHDPSMHIASGRVDHKPYESILEITGSTVKEHFQYHDMRTFNNITYLTCDLTVNYSLIRRECLGPSRLHWDDDIKIGGGEHGAFFFDAFQLGFKVCVVQDVSIREIPFNFSQMHPEYPQFRHRARQPGRLALKRRGIDKWVLQDGSVEIT